MSGRAASGPRGIPYAPAPCKRCTGLGDAHYLTCPTLRLGYVRRSAIEVSPGAFITLLEASGVMNRRLADAAEAGLSVREAVAAWAREEGDVR